MDLSERTPKMFAMYVLGYILLMEWLLPLPEVSDTGFVPMFMMASAFFFLVTFFRFPWWLHLLLIGGSILYTLHTVFFNISFLSPAWWVNFSNEISVNTQTMLSGEWQALTDPFRTFLFLLLLAVMSYLVYFWVIQAKRILFFFVFTIIYIGIMDTFLPYNGSSAIIRVFAVGFVLLALLQWDRLSEYFPGERRGRVWLRWAALTMAVLVTATGIGIAAPKSEPKWADPVPFLQARTGVDGDMEDGGAAQRIGYGANDERLGGGFEMNDSPVFTAVGTESGYWRGESKDEYTGLGWETDLPQEGTLNSSFYEEATPTEEQRISVTMAEGRTNEFAFYPGSAEEITASGQEVSFSIDRYTGRADASRNGESFPLSSYDVVYEDPAFPVEEMREVTGDAEDEVNDAFLQVPDDLPDSIGSLAAELTAEEDNRYDQVKAVENYLRGPDFTYDTQDVAVPEEGTDYVEQFLFETQTGYCDNFSTSMAVMLRTLDIPTRWVKGYTSGEMVESSESESVYEVTNANAHSWVEVYFPDVGWVPFEPTRGFDSEADYIFANNDEAEETPEEEEEQPEEEQPEEQEEPEEAAADSFTMPVWPFFLLAALAAVLGFVFRKKLIAAYLLTKYRDVHDTGTFVKSFHSLIWLLGYAGWKKESSETMREYAERMDHHYQTNDMGYLTREFEKYYYGGRAELTDVEKANSIWKEMVHRITP
ncbi:transglutaminase superfamily protein [Sinobaca qinghaiensis]|uniref:Transglutaminase superfamily protein n=1 Tax=Sinobaca qinghaiensis TaxID=342944 RepID=A0A419V010_9BACL|nr:transglutaminaseTgpA domain-containing protein [Sinobaca qinghaiensis]RKD71273.1 transglutaminase superfamily protein [Sinobaca qinghaiensis]